LIGDKMYQRADKGSLEKPKTSFLGGKIFQHSFILLQSNCLFNLKATILISLRAIVDYGIVSSMKYASGQKSSANKFFAYLLICAGIIELFSCLAINPWIGKFWWHKPIIQVYDVIFSYFFWSLCLGILTLLVGFLVIKTKVALIENIAISYLIISALLLSDRLLLAGIGLPLWVPDTKTHYRNRPNTLRNWGEKYQNKLSWTNRYGHYDDNFPKQKSDDEFRGLILGDSVSMGHGVTSDEAFANQLEKILRKYGAVYNTYQIINTAVQGYSIWQEYQIFLKSLEFKPDFCALGFCMNDVTEPFSVSRNLGGPGLDYQGVMQISNAFFGYLVNETGYGRLVLGFFGPSKFRQVQKLQSIYNVSHMISHSFDDPKVQQAWKTTLSDLQRVNELANDNHIPFVLLIFPFNSQLFNQSQDIPQKILIAYARQHNINAIDFTNIFQDQILEDIATATNSVPEKLIAEDIQKIYPEYINIYYLDEDHFTAKGHQIIALRLFKYLRDKKLIRADIEKDS